MTANTSANTNANMTASIIDVSVIKLNIFYCILKSFNPTVYYLGIKVKIQIFPLCKLNIFIVGFKIMWRYCTCVLLFWCWSLSGVKADVVHSNSDYLVYQASYRGLLSIGLKLDIAELALTMPPLTATDANLWPC